MERWQQIQGFEGLYDVSDKGRVYSYYSNKILTGVERKDGYIMVILHKNGKKFTKKIHRIVAENFIPNPEGLPEAHHIDEDKLNNKVSNLQWVTHQYNNEYSKSKSYVLYDIDDEKIEIFNLEKFAKDNGIDGSTLLRVAKGKLNSYHGFTKHPGVEYTMKRKGEFTLISPEGHTVTFQSQKAAADYLEDCQGNISQLLKGKIKSCKGWTLP